MSPQQARPENDGDEQWQEWFEAKELAYLQSLGSEVRRKALSRELRARAYEECAFLGVEVRDKDANGQEYVAIRRIWDGRTRDTGTGAPDPDEDLVNRWVEVQLEKVEEAIVRAARVKALEAMEDAADFEAPDTETFARLTDALDAELEPTDFLIDGMLAERENLILAAGYKAGKSTLAMHLTKSLATGTSFLGNPVKPIDGTIVYWDAELDLNYAVDQFRALNMSREATDRIVYRNLKGFALPLHTEHAFEWAAKDLAEQKCKVLIIDTFGRIFSGDENNNNDVRDFLLRLDLLKRRAAVESVILITHTGHAQEGKKTRSRGASYFGDWAGSLWSLERTSNDDANTVRRLQVGTGRGVEAHTLHYTWSPERGIELSDAPVTEKKGQSNELSGRVWDYVRHNPRSSIINVVKGLDLKPGSRNTIATILKKYCEDGSMTVEMDASSKLFSVLEIFNEFD